MELKKRTWALVGLVLLPPMLLAGVIAAMMGLGAEGLAWRILRRVFFDHGSQVVFFYLATASLVILVGRSRFSWRTLVLSTLFITSGTWLAPNWTAWVETLRIPEADMIRLSPDGGLIAASKGTTLRLHDSFTGALEHVLPGHGGKVWGFSFSPDGGQVATGDLAGTVRIWSTRTGRLISRLGPSGGDVWPIEFSSDGRLLLVCGRRRISPTPFTEEIHVWDILRLERVLSVAGGVHSMLSPDGRRLLVRFKSYEMLDVESGRQLLCLDVEGSPLGFSTDGREIWFRHLGTVYRVDAQNGSLLGPKVRLGWPPPASPRAGFMDVVLSPDRSRCFAFSRDHFMRGRIYDPATGKLLSSFFCGEPGFPQFSAEADRLVLDEWTGSDTEHDIHVYTCRRPEAWWGVLTLKEFWATALFAAALVWSILRDRRTLRGAPQTGTD